MLWCQGARNIGLSNHELKSALKCTVITIHAVPDRRTGGQTDGRINITAIARRFVVTNASRAKKLEKDEWIFTPLQTRHQHSSNLFHDCAEKIHHIIGQNQYKFKRDSSQMYCFKICWRGWPGDMTINHIIINAIVMPCESPLKTTG